MTISLCQFSQSIFSYIFLIRAMVNLKNFACRRTNVTIACSVILFYTLIIFCMQDSQNPTIYAITSISITPTSRAQLTRMSHLFRLVPNLFWVIVEDANVSSDLVINLLSRTNLTNKSVKLSLKSPPGKSALEKLRFVNTFDDKGKRIKKMIYTEDAGKGFAQLNFGLNWVKKRCQKDYGHSIVYFMNKNYAYSVELFEEMAKIKRGSVGIWNVGLVGGLKVEGPIVEQNSVIGFNSMLPSNRTFAINIAGFAISCDLIRESSVVFNEKAKINHHVNEFLEQITTVEKLQPIAVNQVNVWFTPISKVWLLGEDERMPSDAGVAA